MAIALVQIGHGGTAGSSATPDVTVTSPTGASNLLVVVVMQSGTTSVTGVTDSASNTYVSAGARASAGGTGTTDVWYCKNCTAGATSVTVAYSANTGANTDVYEFSGADTSSPLDTQTTATASTAGLGSAITPAVVGEVLLSGAVPNAANLTGVSSPWTTGGTVAIGDGGFSGYYISAPTSSQQIPYTPTTTQTLVSSSVAFKAASGGDSVLQTTTTLIF